MNSVKQANKTLPPGRIFQTRTMPNVDIYEMELSKVSDRSLEIYKNYVERGVLGASEPSLQDRMKYKHYTNEVLMSEKTVQC